MLRKLTILWLCAVALVTSASAQDAEKVLKQFEGKVLILRHPLRDDSLKYDAEGKVLKGGGEEPWTSHGGILIEHIKLTPDTLHLTGKRMLFMFSPHDFAMMEFKNLHRRLVSPPFSPSLDIVITLDQPVASEEQARKVLSNVFALNTEDLLASVPDFWRPCLTDHLAYDSSQAKDAEFSWRAPTGGSGKPLQSSVQKSSDDLSVTEVDEPVAHVGDGVSAPRPVYTPEPKFSEVARCEKFQGVVLLKIIVGTDGKIHNAQITRALGMGLDETALATTKTWRFDPSRRNGEPVAVEINIEVSFNLY
jgi:TonB family protein